MECCYKLSLTILSTAKPHVHAKCKLLHIVSTFGGTFVERSSHKTMVAAETNYACNFIGLFNIGQVCIAWLLASDNETETLMIFTFPYFVAKSLVDLLVWVKWNMLILMMTSNVFLSKVIAEFNQTYGLLTIPCCQSILSDIAVGYRNLLKHKCRLYAKIIWTQDTGGHEPLLC